MFTRIRGLVVIAVVITLAYPAFLFGEFLGNEVMELPQAITERPYQVVLGVVVNFLVLGFLLHLTRSRRQAPKST